MRIFTSLRFRLILLVLLAILPLAGMSVYRIQEDRRSAGERTAAEALNLARLAAISQQTLVDQGQQLLFTLAQLDVVRAGDPAACNALLAHLLPNYPHYTNILVVNPDGRPRCSATPSSGAVNYTDRDWFQRAMQTRAFTIGSFVIGRITGKPSLPMAFPILDSQGQPQAMVVIALDLELVSVMSAELDLPPRSTVNLVDTQGNVLARYPNPENWLGKNLGAVPLVQGLLAHQAEGTIEEAGLDGILRLYGYVPVQSGGQTWGYLFIGIPSQVAYAAADQTWRSSLIVFGLVTALALAATWALGEFSITRRTQALVRTVKRLAAGDQSVRSGMRYGVGEISQLGRAFDEMAETLQQRETERKRAEAEIHRRADEFAALYDTARDLAKQQDLPTLLQAIVDRAAILLAASGGGMYLYDETRGDLHIVVSKDSPLPVGARVKLGEGMAGHVAQTHQPLIVNNYRTWEGRLPQYEGMPIAAAVEVPMILGGELIGVLAVFEKDETARQFTEADARLLSLFASHAAGAVHNARLLGEALARAEQLGLLYDAGLTLNRTLDPRVQLELLCTIATKALHSDNTSFFLYDAAQNDLHLEFGVGLVQEKESMRAKRFPLGVERGLVGWVAQNRAPLYLSDVTADPRWIVTDPEIRSALWVPVLHDEQLLGVLSASSTRVRAFTSQDEHLFVLFSNQVAVAMENARLFDETRRRLAELEGVSRISSALRSAETFEEMLPRILDEALAVLNSAAGSLILYDPTSKDLRESVSRGWFTDLGSSSLRASEGIAGHVFTTGEMHLAREFAQDPLVQPSALPALPAGQGGACVPIRSTQEIVGVLFVSVALPRELTASEAHLLTTLAEIAGNAIQRMRLHEKTQRDARRFAALHSIDIAISSSLELSDTLNLLLEQVVDLLNVDAADVLLLNPITSTLEYSAGRGFRSRAIEQSRLRLGEGFAGRAALERRTLDAPDLQSVGSEFVRSKLLAGEDFVTYFSVPLTTKDKVLGVLDVFKRAPLTPDQEWLDFLASLASQAAIAIDNASLFEGLQRSNIELALAYETTIEGWSRALDLRDKETEGHSQRVTELTLKLARVAGMTAEELAQVRRGALLHDIGKMGVPDQILFKPDKLTQEEWDIVHKHPTLAFELLSPIMYLRSALDIPYCHHEKWDGSGYPRGLKGRQIPLAARLFAVVDVWDALRADRPYRKGWDDEKVLEYIQAGSGTHFDPKVVVMFLDMMNKDE